MHSLRYRCTNKVFKASLSTVIDEHEVLKTGSEHNHPPLSEHKKEIYTTRSSLKRIATEDINERSSKLVCETVASLPTITAKDVDDLCRLVLGNRLKTRPKLSKNRVQSLMVLNEHPSHLITEIDETLEIGVISTKENLGFIASSSHILADGTLCTLHVRPSAR